MEETANQVEKSESWRDIVCIVCIAYLTPVAAIPVWLVSRWSNATKWVVTLISIIALLLLSYTSYGGLKYAKFQKSYTPVLEVQQALDVYGIEKGKYPDKLDDLTPDLLKEVPLGMDYTKTENGKSYSLKAQVQGKNVDLGPLLKAK